MNDLRDGDLRSLARVTARDVPSLPETARVRHRVRARHTGEEIWMSIVTSVRRRPLAAGALGIVALAAALLVVPVSYQHTVGYSVQLSAHVPDAAVGRVSSELAKALHASNVSMNAGESDQVAFVADVPMGARSSVNAAANAFARELTRRGYAASATVTPRVERVSGTVYAYAADAVNEIRVDGAGKSDDQIESEIRSQLQAAGFSQPEVDVTTTGDKRQVQVMLHKDANDTAASPPPSISITDGDKKIETDKKQVTLQLTPEDTAGKTDAEIQAMLEEKLRAQGVEATVEVKDGKVIKVNVTKE